jgi:hypothetical protein
LDREEQDRGGGCPEEGMRTFTEVMNISPFTAKVDAPDSLVNVAQELHTMTYNGFKESFLPFQLFKLRYATAILFILSRLQVAGFPPTTRSYTAQVIWRFRNGKLLTVDLLKGWELEND